MFMVGLCSGVSFGRCVCVLYKVVCCGVLKVMLVCLMILWLLL